MAAKVKKKARPDFDKEWSRLQERTLKHLRADLQTLLNGGIAITGLEANLLLFLLDDYVSGTWQNGRVIPGYPRKQMKQLRDRMFGAHRHPEEEE